jgi:hypothetical protein
MNQMKTKLIRKALKKYKRIYPCSKCKGFPDSFTRNGNTIYFWFCTKDKSTHLVAEKIQ